MIENGFGKGGIIPELVDIFIDILPIPIMMFLVCCVIIFLMWLFPTVGIQPFQITYFRFSKGYRSLKKKEGDP